VKLIGLELYSWAITGDYQSEAFASCYSALLKPAEHFFLRFSHEFRVIAGILLHDLNLSDQRIERLDGL
jgi:hypothetical protein